MPLIAAKTRDEINDALCAITQAMLRDVRGHPSDELLRRAMRGWAFVVPRPEPREMPADVRLALSWVARASRPLADLMDPVPAASSFIRPVELAWRPESVRRRVSAPAPCALY